MELYRELQGHTACVCSIIAEPILSDEEYSSYRRSVFSGSHDWTIRVWDAAGILFDLIYLFNNILLILFILLLLFKIKLLIIFNINFY